MIECWEYKTHNIKVLENTDSGFEYNITEKDGKIKVVKYYNDDPRPPEEQEYWEVEFDSMEELTLIYGMLDDNMIEAQSGIFQRIRDILDIPDDEDLISGIKKRYKK